MMEKYRYKCAILDLMAVLLLWCTGIESLKLKKVKISYIRTSEHCLKANADKFVMEANVRLKKTDVDFNPAEDEFSFQIQVNNKKTYTELCPVKATGCRASKQDGCYCAAYKQDTRVKLIANLTARPEHSQGRVKVVWKSGSSQDTQESKPSEQLDHVYEPPLPSLKLNGTVVSTFNPSCELTMTENQSYLLEFCVDRVNLAEISFQLGPEVPSSPLPVSGNCAAKNVTGAANHFGTNYGFSFREGEKCSRRGNYSCLVKKRGDGDTDEDDFDLLLTIVSIVAVAIPLLALSLACCVFAYWKCRDYRLESMVKKCSKAEALLSKQPRETHDSSPSHQTKVMTLSSKSHYLRSKRKGGTI